SACTIPRQANDELNGVGAPLARLRPPFFHMNFIILAHPADETAIRVAVLLRQRHDLHSVEVRTAEELLFAQWEHRLWSGGIANRIRLHDDTLLADSKHTVVFNRLTAIELAAFASISPSDREYARTETFALLLSWLAGFERRVVNPPSPSGLSGGTYRPL